MQINNDEWENNKFFVNEFFVDDATSKEKVHLYAMNLKKGQGLTHLLI